MDLVFEHDPRGETFTRITRGDGVVLGLPSYSRKFRVPHDLAHAAVERSLGLSGGIFGSIAAGGVFDNMTVLHGKPRHDARDRSRRVLKAASGSIAVAESLVGVLHRAVEHRRRPPFAAAREAWGVIRAEPYPFGDADIRGAVELLAGLVEVWSRQAEPLEFAWPSRLRAG
ncbi:hypothetical protein AB0878_32390 [Amycolatopsis sp. NPDC047767]|uniref:hypothetical protein n=1 Tax=Amycolatopsis sp. NPDC047767 TaxID=3156765 RepID=UPI003455AC49